MNALVAQRINATGMLSPTPALRAEVAAQLKSRLDSASSAVRKAGQATLKNDTATRNIDPELGREAFLQLLVLELQNQDPLEPLGNQDMLAQLAQFSALEQMQNLNDEFAMFSGNIDQLNFIAASGLVGQEIAAVDITGQPVSGVVSSVHQEDSMIYLTVGDHMVAMAGVVAIGPSDD